MALVWRGKWTVGDCEIHAQLVRGQRIVRRFGFIKCAGPGCVASDMLVARTVTASRKTMKLTSNRTGSVRSHVAAGFTILEVVIGVAAVGLLFVTFYTGFTQGFAIIQAARENLRATQILEEKMETIRLYRWEQVTDDDFIPDTFTAPFYAVGTNVAAGVTYSGRMTITNVNMPEASYATNMRMVIVRLQWNSGNTERFREMRTLVTRYGLQQYIY